MLPIAVAVGAIVAGIYYWFSTKNAKKHSPPKEPVPSTSGTGADSGIKKTLLDPTAKYLLPLVEKEVITHDTVRFRFGLPTADHILGLPIGQHIALVAQINGEPVVRAYTPVSSDESKGYVDLVVKVYRRSVHPKFPEGGKMSQHLDAMKVGDTIAFRGPNGKLQYLGKGQFSVKVQRKDPPKQLSVKRVNMIAGGSGVTPMLQLIRNVLVTNAGKDTTVLSLLFANQTEDDILLRKELDDLAQKYPEQFRVWYTLDKPPTNWTYSSGFINADMIRDHLYSPSKDTVVLMCGPPPMINFACTPSLDTLGYDADLRVTY